MRQDETWKGYLRLYIETERNIAIDSFFIEGIFVLDPSWFSSMPLGGTMKQQLVCSHGVRQFHMMEIYKQ